MDNSDCSSNTLDGMIRMIKINYFIDLLMVILFIAVSLSGLIIFFFLPSGSGWYGVKYFFGIPRHNIVDIHNWSGFALIVLITAHIILHYKWIIETTKNLFKQENKTQE
ncbi:MAG: DUF4405 domain-containing protein [Candidatus Bilamarchaeaceae archaeon]